MILSYFQVIVLSGCQPKLMITAKSVQQCRPIRIN